MQMDTGANGPSVGEQGVSFRSLSLGGVKGRVRANLTESQVSFESKNGHALDLKLDAIQRVHHHHTTLIPGWLGIVGLILVWIAWRGVTGKAQALLGAAGIVLSSAHLLTRRPTLTIDTDAGDCHTVFGSDLSMMRLGTLIQKIQNGMSLSEAKDSIDNMINDSEYPRSNNPAELELAPEPIELSGPPVIGSFLDSMQFDFEESVIDAEVVNEPEPVADLELPDWFDTVGEPEPEPETVIPAGLMSRAVENLHTQRHNVVQNGWQPPQQQPYQGVHRNQMVDAPSYGMMQHHGFQQSYQEPVGQPEFTPPPTNFLPSFVGMDGAHVPGAEPASFSSPDTPLSMPEEEEPQASLVESARRDDIIEAQPVVEEPKESPKERYPAMSRFSSKKGARRIKNRKPRKGRLSGSSVVRELVGPSIDRASAISRRLLRRSRTGDAIRIQAEQSRQAQVADSIRNLAQSRGGEISDEEVDEMMSHITPRQDIPTSFSELTSSESKRSESERVSSLPRLDD